MSQNALKKSFKDQKILICIHQVEFLELKNRLLSHRSLQQIETSHNQWLFTPIIIADDTSLRPYMNIRGALLVIPKSVINRWWTRAATRKLVGTNEDFWNPKVVTTQKIEAIPPAGPPRGKKAWKKGKASSRGNPFQSLALFHILNP